MDCRQIAVGLGLLMTIGCGAGSSPETDSEAAAMAAPPAPAPGSPEAKIALAESAAPASISGAATIAEFDAEGKMVTLREGTNGWLCIPDDAAVPGEDPICVDGAWQQWFGAYMEKKPPAIQQVGVAYMLRGGAFASNEDPFATAPPAGQDWMRDGPHTMIIVPDARQLEGIPTDPHNGGPYVMWKGTPYAHIMVPAGSAQH